MFYEETSSIYPLTDYWFWQWKKYTTFKKTLIALRSFQGHCVKDGACVTAFC